jgi:hypothetical protein
MLIKILCGLILVSDDTPTLTDKFIYHLSVLFALSPVVYL